MNITAFDFTRKTETPLGREQLDTGPDPALFHWIDLEAADEPDVPSILARFRVNPAAAGEFTGPDREGRYDVHDDCLHFALSEGRIENERLVTSHVDILLGGNYLMMWHRYPVHFLDPVRRVYREDFRRFAQTPGFLVYELCDHLIESYRRTAAQFSTAVEGTQLNLFGTVTDDIFRHVSALTTDLLAFRRIVLAARELLHQLASRRSLFLVESTQTFLASMAGTVERISDDISAEREALGETLNLYMGMVSHRTNRVINRLTVLSMIFLPLTFICGVYGMNFEVMPELQWAWSYPIFWTLCLVFVSFSLWKMRRHRWL